MEEKNGPASGTTALPTPGPPQGLREFIRDVVREELKSMLTSAMAQAEPAQTIRPPAGGSEGPLPSLDQATYSVEDVARLLGCTVKAVYGKAARGQLPGVLRVGRTLRFRGRELLPFLLEGRVPSPKGRRR